MSRLSKTPNIVYRALLTIIEHQNGIRGGPRWSKERNKVITALKKLTKDKASSTRLVS